MHRLSLSLLGVVVVAGLAAAPAVTPAWADLPAACAQVPADMKCVPEGDFIRGSDVSEKDQRPQATIWVSTFFMDTYEVTNADYKKCAQAGACRRHAPAYKVGFSGAHQPVVGVKWFDARDYCAWAGKRLPTEAEWEKAARGPDGDLYPWGNDKPTCTRAIIMENGKKGCGLGGPPKWATADVGTRDPGAYGLYDMAGNSWEWVQDWYSKSYAACGDACTGRDPKGPCGGADECPGHRHRAVRSGSWWWTWEYAAGSWRRAHLPGNTPYHHFGFRCAASVPAAAPTPAAPTR